jgi:uncharacterized membrane protein YedE/YeeE
MELDKLILGALLNGVIVGFVGFTVSTLLMIAFEHDFSFKKYTFWFRVFLGSFITGILMYIFRVYVKY